MRTFTRAILFSICFFIPANIIFAQDQTIESITVSQVDTFALRGMPNQPVIKINIRVTGTGNPLTLQRIAVRTQNQDNTDVDSSAIYWSINDRFSFADYGGEEFLWGKRKKIVADSISVISSITLYTGDNYFWVVMDLNKFSRASHTLDAYIPANGITISGVKYPAGDQSPTGNVGIAEVFFRENFETKDLNGRPVGWNQDRANGIPFWINNKGGYTISTSGHPSSPKSGNLNIMIEKESYDLDSTMVFKQIDLSLATHPQLSFYHAQVAWQHDDHGTVILNDRLRVMYKIGLAGTWKELKYYQLATPNHWLKREFLLPDEAANKNFYLGFRGLTNYGWGTCVDSVVIYETGVANREVKSIDVRQPMQDVVPQGSDQNPIVRMNLRVKGNTNSITLNSIKVTSLNTSDADIAANGVKLFYTQDSVFLSPVQWGTSQSFSGGTVTFSGLSKVLETGDNYLWVTYDLKTTAFPGHVLDAKINTGDVSLSGVGVTGSYPDVDKSPDGSRLIKQTLFFDSFEGAPAWTLTGEFQIGAPQGKGGVAVGNSDPTSAYSGSKVLGTDLTGLGSNLGDYEPNIRAATAYLATSPLIDGKYFKNINLSFYRWLNLDNTDTAFIEYKIQGESSWKKLWKSQIKYIDADWKLDTISNLNFLDRKKFNLRFGLGYTDAIDNYSGWNIDYLFFTADSVPYDAAIVKYVYPLTSCDLSANEHVKVYVKNNGPNNLVNTPIKLSIDGGKNYLTETIPGPIIPDDSILYTFTTAVNLSKASAYDIKVKVAHPRDNYSINDTVENVIQALPTYSLPYHTGFEQDTTFWNSHGINSSWIEDYNSTFPPVEGSKCWKTDYSGYHFLNEKSYVESPCFNFTGKEIPMIDMKYSFNINNLTGAILEYSLDQGQTWTYAREDNYPFPWNWYNDTVPTLKHKGWTGQTVDASLNQTWKQGRQILPAALANQSQVRLRVSFKSDSANISRMPGFAFDDVKVYDAPFDIGVTAINGTNNPACQNENSPYLNVTIQNFGYRRMKTGDTIVIGAKVNGVLQAVDTIKLAANLIRNATLNYTFKKKVNFNAAGSYTIKAFTMIENDKTFYGGANNDTASVSFTVNQNPVTNLKKSYSTARLDTLWLKPASPAGYGYSWEHNSATASTQNYLASEIGTYHLTVTNPGTLCQTKDTINVYALQVDAGVTQIIAPVTSCGYGTAFKPIIQFKNFGTDTLAKNKKIPFRIRLNAGSLIKDSIYLSKAVAPDSSYTVTLNTAFNLSVGGAYQLMVRTYMPPYDIDVTNDSVRNSFTIYGFPSVELGPDVYSKTLSYTLPAPLGYNSYHWSDNSTNDTLIVTNSGKYVLTVTNANGCETKDSVYVRLGIHDLAIKRVISPVTFCTKPGLSTISCKLMNNGTDTIKTSETIVMSYAINEGTPVTENFSPTSNIMPNDTSVTFTFTQQQDIHNPSTYNFWIKATAVGDLRRANDSVLSVVKVFANPAFDLGADLAPAEAQHKIDPGKYSSYLWQDNSTDSIYIITQTHFENTYTYSVTVTDVNGCKANDNVRIELYVNDLKANSIDLPDPLCSQTFPLKVGIRNTGNQSYYNQDFTIKYWLNSDTEVERNFQFTGNPNEIKYFTFPEPAVSDRSGTNKILINVNLTGDVRRNNDTLSQSFNLLNGPTIDLGGTNGTLQVDLPHTLDAGGSFTYEWNTSDKTRTISVNSPGTYTVTVTNGACTATQSVQVIGNKYDLSLSGFNVEGHELNWSTCKLPKKQAAFFEVQNMGNVDLANEPITLMYQINSQTPVSKAVSFTGGNLSQMQFFVDSLDLSQAVIDTFKISLSYSKDQTIANNSTSKLLNVLSHPVITFVDAVNDTIKAKSLPATLNPGSGTGYTYAWYDGATTQTISTSIVKRWHQVTVSNGYCSTKDSVYLTDATPVFQINGQKGYLSLYPNPVSDILNVELSIPAGTDVTYEFYSTSGALIKTGKLSSKTTYTQTVDVSDLPKGLYYMRIFRKDWATVEKVMVQ